MKSGDWAIWEMPSFSYIGFVQNFSQNEEWGSLRVTQIINRGDIKIVSSDSEWFEPISFPLDQAKTINDNRRIDNVNFLIDFALSDNDKETFLDLVKRYKQRNLQ